MDRPIPPVLHHDERIVVIDKPSGLLSVPGIGPEKADCAVARVATAYAGARIVHRLDRDTSGVLIMARDAEAHRDLSIQFQDRRVEKVYHAIVAGHVEDDEGLIDLPIRKDLDDAPRQIVDHVHGKPSQTKWTVVARTGAGDPGAPDGAATRLALFPLTGRSHQLRLHLLSIGHPILGDNLYAPDDILARAERLLLHATKLTVAHPSDARSMTFEARCPF